MGKIVMIQPDGRNLLEILTGQFYELPSFCAGRGTCGKCKVRIRKEGEKSSDLIVLACQYVPLECCEVEVLEEEAEFWIETGVGERVQIKEEFGCRSCEESVDKMGERIRMKEEDRKEKDREKMKEKDRKNKNRKNKEEYRENKEYRQIVVDIGTTTLAMLLLNGAGEVLSSWTGLNPQRRYGADVISRIERAGRGDGQELTDCIRREILIGMERLCGCRGKEEQGRTTEEESRIEKSRIEKSRIEKSRIEKSEIEKSGIESSRIEERRIEKSKESTEQIPISKVVIAGNTTMQHLFAGYSVEGLGGYPFSVVQKDLAVGRLAEFYPVLPAVLGDAEYVLMPCVSAFVGGDIMAGILEVEWQRTADRQGGIEGGTKSWFLLDMGTNGEMVLYSKGVYFTASTAAGPVFEGGNISYGIGSVTGAIDHVWERNGELEYSTIGGQAPIGICGTGLIESMAALRKMGILDREGRLVGYTESGYGLAKRMDGEIIRITQEDVRQFQLAKAAIRSGMEILCHTAKVDMQELDRIYLAGGFGTKLDVKKSCEVGLLPAISRNRCQVLGNASLSGGSVYCLEEQAEKHLQRIQKSSREVTLALEHEFQKRYLKYMYF